MKIPEFGDREAPRAPFAPGDVPAAAWFCIETVFGHECPQPEAMLSTHGLAAEEGEDALAACARHGLGREVATEGTLKRLAAAFAAQDAGGRGLLLTRDHAGVGAQPDTRAAGWIKALHAEGGRLWAWIELTPWGHGLVDHAEFSFFSTEYDYADFVRTAAGAEPSRLAGCTLTNSPRHAQQVPCTNMAALQARACATQTTHTTRYTTMNDSIDEQTRPAPHGGSGETPPKGSASEAPLPEETAANAAMAGAEPEPEPAATNGDCPAGADLDSAIAAAADLMGLPDDAVPADLLAAVKDLKRSNDELRAALAEANKNAPAAGAATNSARYPRLLARAANAATLRLAGHAPNRELTVRVGHGVRAVNSQAKAKADYCAAAVQAEEKALGRRLCAAEYNRAWSKANADYDQGANR